MTPKELNELLASTRDQKFRKVSQARIDGINRMTAGRIGTKHKEETIQKLKDRYSEEEMRKVQASKFLGKTHDKKTREKIRNANLGKDRKGAEWVKKMAEKKLGNQCHAKPFMTPSGAFASKKLACDWCLANGMSNPNGKFGKWLKEKSTEFYYITQEEYDKIKHIEPQPGEWMLTKPRKRRSKE